MNNKYRQTLFLERYNVNEVLLEDADLEWITLEKIIIDYKKHKLKLEEIATTLSSNLMKMEKVHSVSYHIIDDENLIAQIIRRKIENKEFNINVETYLTEITNLISLQATHLFKEDWNTIHQEVTNYWDLKEDPIVYIRTGGSELIGQEWVRAGGAVDEYQYGYRSIHYIIVTKPAKTTYYAEIQVKTI